MAGAARAASASMVRRWPFRPRATPRGRRSRSCGSTSSRSRLSACLAMLAVPDGLLIDCRPPSKICSGPQDRSRRRPGAIRIVYAAVALPSSSAMPVTAWGWVSRSTRRRNMRSVQCWRRTRRRERPEGARTRALPRPSVPNGEIANYLERLNPPESSVITDTVFGFAIIAASRHPKPSWCRRIRTSSRCSTISDRKWGQVPVGRAPDRPRNVRCTESCAIRRCTRPVPTSRRWNWRYPTTVTVSRRGGCIGCLSPISDPAVPTTEYPTM